MERRNEIADIRKIQILIFYSNRLSSSLRIKIKGMLFDGGHLKELIKLTWELFEVFPWIIL